MPDILEWGWAGTADAPYSRAELYDAAAYGVDPLAVQWLLERFEILSRPRQRVGSQLRRGDILLRRGEGGFAHASVIVDPQFRSGLEVLMQGGTAEIGGSGNFVFVAERGARPHDEHERFARRVTDETGRILGKQVVLRPREGAGESERVDPISLMVGMSIAQMSAPHPTTRVEVVAPPDAAPTGEWEAANFESEFAECTDPHHNAEIDLSWPTSCHKQSHTEIAQGIAGESDASSAEFASPEHHRLGDSIQVLVNNWAKTGLISGGCFVIDSEGEHRPLPLAQWQYFLPDRSHPNRPYGDDPHRPEKANWHWITPNALNDSNGRPWTADTLATAVRNGTALTLSIGDLIMTSGDIVAEFGDYAAAASTTWRAQPVNVASGLARGDGFAYCIVRRLAFPRTGTDARHDAQMVARAHVNPAAMAREVASPDDRAWVAVRSLVSYLNRARGNTGYHQLRVLTRLQRRDGLMTIENIQRVAPYLTATDSTQLLADTRRAGFSFGPSTSIDSDAFQMVVSNGAYAELALHNELHFAPTRFPNPDPRHPLPGNWPAFEVAQTAALQMIDALATASGSSTSQEHGPIPANAIAQLTHGMHFLTDAFSSGHMRVPRHQVGAQGSLLAGVMHDFDNSLGLIVENGFRERWRAFGDGHLERFSPQQTNLLQAQAAATHGGTHPIDPRPEANRDHAFGAVASAMKQLHYQAQKYFGDATHSTQYQEILRNNRGTAAGLMHDDILSHNHPGDGSGRDAWLAMDIPAKTNYMRKHRPVPLPEGPDWRRSGTSNHPALVTSDATASLVVYNTHDYALDQHLASDHALYEIDLTGASEFKQDITKYVLLAVLTPDSAISWAGTREVYLPRAIRQWPDHRGTIDAILRWAAGLASLGLP